MKDRLKAVRKATVLFLRRMWYRILWRVRWCMLPVWGLDCRQTDDMKGVIMPSGKFVGYGRPFYRLYFLGRIRSPCG